MSLIIEDPEVERLVAEVAAATGVSETDAIRTALRAHKEAITTDSAEARWQKVRRALERDIATKIPPHLQGVPLTQEEQDTILGYGPNGH